MRLIVLAVLCLCLTGCGGSSSAAPGGNSTQPGSTQAELFSGRLDNLVEMTEAAAAKVRTVPRSANAYLRIVVKRGGPAGINYEISFDPNFSPAKDYLCDSRGVKVLVDHESAMFMLGTRMDYGKRPDGSEGFFFENPSALRR